MAKRPGVILPKGYVDRRGWWRSLLAWTFVAAAVSAIALSVARYLTTEDTKTMKADADISGRPLLTFELKYPTRLTVGEWAIVTATLTDHSAPFVSMEVPLETNATLQPLQAGSDWCNLTPDTACVLQWAVKATSPGAIVFHVLPTFKRGEPLAQVGLRLNTRIPIIAGDSASNQLTNILTPLTTIFNLFALALGVANTLVTIFRPIRVNA